MNQQIPRFRNAEIDEICEGLIRQYEGDAYGTRPINIINFAINYFNLKIIYASIAEDDMNKLSFLSDGKTPIKVYYQGRVQCGTFPEKTILIDKFLKRPSERNRRCFCIAHEVYHYIESVMTNSSVVAAYYREFDSSREYPLSELYEMMSIRECQADYGAAALLMPPRLLKNAYMRFSDNKPVRIYGENVFTANDKAILQNIADYLGVSYTALTIRMKQLKLFERHKLEEYITTEMHLGNTKAGG